MSAQPKLKYTLEEYLELDRHSEERLEYWDGEVFSMSGVSPNHNQIEINLTLALGPELLPRGCRIFAANTRIKVPSFPPYRYGDVSALCGQPIYEEIGGVAVLTNPMLIIEVLSPSTEAKDRGTKFSHYKSIPSFREYLLVSQDRPNVAQFLKQGDGFWLHREFDSPDDIIKITSLDCELSLRAIYQYLDLIL